MHEMALGRSLVDLLAEAARTEGFTRVRRVTLAIGQLGPVDPESLAFCFDIVAKGSLAEGAELVIERLPGQAHCRDCGDTVPIRGRADPCPVCGGHELSVTGGDDVRVTEVEVV